MSSSLFIYFRECAQDDATQYIADTEQSLKYHMRAIIQENIWTSPFMNDRCTDKYSQHNTQDATFWRDKYELKMWLEGLFAFKAIYWENYELLGLIGNFPKSVTCNMKSVYFQNSTDQDYAYDTWKGIHAFQSSVDKYGNANTKELISVFPYLSADDIRENRSYYQKCAVYKDIEGKLKISKYLDNGEDENGEFSVIHSCILIDPEIRTQCMQYAKVMRQKYAADQENQGGKENNDI